MYLRLIYFNNKDTENRTMNRKYYIKEVSEVYKDNKGERGENNTVIGCVWIDTPDVIKHMDINLFKLPQEHLVTELDYHGNELMVMRPQRLKAFPDTPYKSKLVATTPSPIKEKLSNRAKVDVDTEAVI